MNPTSLNNRRTEKDYTLLKTISKLCIAVQLLIKKIAYIATVNKYGDNLIAEKKMHS